MVLEIKIPGQKPLRQFMVAVFSTVWCITRKRVTETDTLPWLWRLVMNVSSNVSWKLCRFNDCSVIFQTKWRHHCDVTGLGVVSGIIWILLCFEVCMWIKHALQVVQVTVTMTSWASMPSAQSASSSLCPGSLCGRSPTRCQQNITQQNELDACFLV